MRQDDLIIFNEAVRTMHQQHANNQGSRLTSGRQSSQRNAQKTSADSSTRKLIGKYYDSGLNQSQMGPNRSSGVAMRISPPNVSSPFKRGKFHNFHPSAADQNLRNLGQDYPNQSIPNRLAKRGSFSQKSENIRRSMPNSAKKTTSYVQLQNGQSSRTPNKQTQRSPQDLSRVNPFGQSILERQISSIDVSQRLSTQNSQLCLEPVTPNHDPEVQRLNQVIAALNKKLASHDDLKRQLDETTQLYIGEQKARDHLREQLALQSQRMESQMSRSIKLQDLIIAENKELKKSNLQKDKTIEQLKVELEQGEFRLTTIPEELTEAGSPLRTQTMAGIRQVIENEEKHDKAMKRELQLRHDLIEEQEQLIRSLESAKAEIGKLKVRIINLELKNDELKLKLEQEKIQGNILDALLEQNENLEYEIKRLKDSRANQGEDDKVNKLQDQINSLTAQKEQLQQDQVENETKIKELMKANLELTAKAIQQDTKTATYADMDRQNKDLKASLELIMKQKQQLQQELLTASECIMESEQKATEANQMAVELLAKLKEADKEVDQLRNLLGSSTQSQKLLSPVKLKSNDNPFI